MALGQFGCAGWPLVGPDYRQPALNLPTVWSQPPARDSANLRPDFLSGWWRQLGDPLLDQLVDEALKNSPDLRSAQARLRQARASRNLAVGNLLPTVNASLTSSKTSATANSPSDTRTLYRGGFDASWEIDLFGGTRRSIEAATADQAASEASLNNTQVSLVAEVVLNYVELRNNQNRLAIARDNLASQSETLAITQWRHQVGLVSGLDVDQALTTREQTRASIPDLENGRVQAENRLAVLLGRNPGTLNERLSTAQALPSVPDDIATGIPADILTQRPDLIAAERKLAAETARVGQKMAARFPSLSLDGSFGWQAYSLGALGGSGTVIRALSGALAATLFDGGKLRSQVEIQSAVQEEALVAYEKSVLTALEEVENALAAYANGRERQAARRLAVASARSAAVLARQMYQSGLSDFQKVLDTERTRLTAEDGLANADAATLTALVQLYKALGGGWESRAAATLSTEKPES